MTKTDIKHLISKETPTIFEIGCADGGDTLDFINTFGNLNIYCFEPEPTNIKLVKERINYPNHYLFEGVISNLDGELTFNRSRTDNDSDLRYSGSIRRPKEHVNEWPQIKFDQFLTVKSIKLDTFCEQNNIGVIDFIWADVQGAEEDMINSGLNTFKNNVRYLYTEYSNKEYYEGQINLDGILNLLGDDWELLAQFRDDVLLKNKKF